MIIWLTAAALVAESAAVSAALVGVAILCMRQQQRPPDALREAGWTIDTEGD